MTVESAGFNQRLPKAITLFLCSVDREVLWGSVRTCQVVVSGMTFVLNKNCLCMCMRDKNESARYVDHGVDSIQRVEIFVVS